MRLGQVRRAPVGCGVGKLGGEGGWNLGREGVGVCKSVVRGAASSAWETLSAPVKCTPGSILPLTHSSARRH